MTLQKDGEFIKTPTVNVSAVHGNLSQQIIEITVDKLSLILHKHANSIEEKKSWIAPLGILTTITLVLITSEFKQIIWSAETWAAFFILSAIASLIWLFRSGCKAYKSETIEDLVEKIKKQN